MIFSNQIWFSICQQGNVRLLDDHKNKIHSTVLLLSFVCLFDIGKAYSCSSGNGFIISCISILN